jgi:hypothetical protein
MAVFRFNPIMAWHANPAGIGVAALFSFQLGARPLALAMPKTVAAVSLISRYASNFVMLVLFLVWTYRVF